MTTATAGRRILVLCAHPDDADVHASGTVARYGASGSIKCEYGLTPRVSTYYY